MQKLNLLFASSVTLFYNTSQNTNEGLVKNLLNKSLKQSCLLWSVRMRDGGRWIIVKIGQGGKKIRE